MNKMQSFSTLMTVLPSVQQQLSLEFKFGGNSAYTKQLLLSETFKVPLCSFSLAQIEFSSYRKINLQLRFLPPPLTPCLPQREQCSHLWGVLKVERASRAYFQTSMDASLQEPSLSAILCFFAPLAWYLQRTTYKFRYLLFILSILI